MHVWNGNMLPGGYRCCNPSVFALLLVPPVRNRQIHEDLGVSLFADHIRALTASFDSKLAEVGNPLVRQLDRYLRWPRVDPVTWRVSQGWQEPAGQSRPSPAMAKLTKRIAFSADQPSTFRLPWLRFSVIFLSCKANARVYDAKSWHGLQSPLEARWLYQCTWQKSLLRQPVWAQNPHTQLTKVYPFHN